MAASRLLLIVLLLVFHCKITAAAEQEDAAHLPDAAAAVHADVAASVDSQGSSGDISEEEEDYEDVEYFETSVDGSTASTGGSDASKGDQATLPGGEQPAAEGAPTDGDGLGATVGDAANAKWGPDGEEDRPAPNILPEVEKKVPLREILLRLKPASLMDEDEREATAPPPPAMLNGTAGSAEDVDLSLGSSAAAAAVSEDSNNNKSSKRAACLPAETKPSVQLLNATGLQALVSPNPNTSSRAVPASCCLMFFFSPACQFSVAASPHVLAMARGLQNVIPVYGIDSVEYHSINAQYGVMGTPTLLLFHNGYSVAQYNFSTYHPNQLLSFLRHHTHISDSLNFTAATLDDLQESPLPLVVVPGSGLWLLSSWLFLLSVAGGCFLRSAFCNRILEAVLNNWREAEAHHHQD